MDKSQAAMVVDKVAKRAGLKFRLYETDAGMHGYADEGDADDGHGVLRQHMLPAKMPDRLQVWMLLP